MVDRLGRLACRRKGYVQSERGGHRPQGRRPLQEGLQPVGAAACSESVGARSLIHPFSWWSGETRNVVYTEPKPETPGLWSQLEKLKVKAWLMDALGKASKTGDSR